MVLSLILPGGVEVTAANSAGLGYTFTTYVVASSEDSGTPDPFAAAGLHMRVGLPASPPAGTYQVKAIGSALTAEAVLTVTYYPSSSIVLATAVDAPAYRVGNFAVVSGFLFNGQTPITGAVVTAVAVPILRVAGTVGGYQLVSQQPAGTGFTDYTYTAQLTNSGGALTAAHAVASSPDLNVDLVSPGLAFGDMAAGATVTSANSFVARVPTGTTFNPATLTWKISSLGTRTNFTLTDSGTYDAAVGDGIYTGTLSLPVAGRYSISVGASGSAGGVAFERTAFAEVTASPDHARIGASSDTPVLDDDTSEILSIEVPVTANVSTAGLYALSMQLWASNGRWTQASGRAALGTGPQQIVLTFTGSQLREFGVDGPYSKKNLALTFDDGDTSVLADHVADGGVTQAYTLSSVRLVRGRFGASAASRIDTNGVAGFEKLRVVSNVFMNGGRCQWSAALFSADGTVIDTGRAEGLLPAGDSQITIDFSGSRIANSLKNGPYKIRDAFVNCKSDAFHVIQADAPLLLETPPWTASQFESAAQDFSVVMLQSSVSTSVGGSSVLVNGKIDGAMKYRSIVDLSISGLPAQVTAEFYPSFTEVGFPFAVRFSATSSAVPGTHSLTLQASSGGVTRTAPIILAVTASPITVSLTPQFVALSESQTQQYTAVVSNAPSSSVSWSMSPILGTLSQSGFYTAPASIARAQDVVVRAASVNPAIFQSATIRLSPAALAVSVAPESVSLFVGQSQQFAAHVLNDGSSSGVTWSMTPQAGTVSQGGLYTAPASISQSQVINVTATSVADPAKSATVTVRLTPVSVFVTPGVITLYQSQTQQFSATVSSGSVTWTLIPPAGTISSTGLYTAPATISSPLNVTVRATSSLDPTRTANALATIRPTQAVTVTPVSSEAYAGQSRLFTAVVTGLTNQQVNWSVPANSGTIDANGLYTAPSPPWPVNPVTVTATSVADPSKSGSVTLTLRQPVSISVAPSGVRLSSGQSLQLAAIVQGTGDTSATWSVNPKIGQVSQTGLYTAPSSMSLIQTINVTAVSRADPSKSATVTVHLVP